ncbi:MAG: hypothetical protein PHU93_02710, partial [Candidatus Gracilibacteria bacterium]|nr:hypothetical protein [Candidatus Gracilibacteria bacterium]
PSNAVYFNNTASYSVAGASTLSAVTAGYSASPVTNTCQFKCGNSSSWIGGSCVPQVTWNGYVFRPYDVTLAYIGSTVTHNTHADICNVYGKKAPGSSWNGASTSGGYCRPENRSFYVVTSNCNWCTTFAPPFTGYSGNIIQPCHVSGEAHRWNGTSWENRGSGGIGNWGVFISGDKVLCAD